MSESNSDINYTDPTKTGEFSTYLRQGDKTNAPSHNEATDRDRIQNGKFVGRTPISIYEGGNKKSFE